MSTKRNKRKIRREFEQRPERCVVLAEDEADVRLFPPLRGGWIPGRNARRVMFGTINLRAGHRVLLASAHGQARDFCAFMEKLCRRYRDRPIALELDEDPNHIARRSKRLAASLDIRLPNRCPELNPMNHLWWSAKEKVSANLQYPSIEAHASRFI